MPSCCNFFGLTRRRRLVYMPHVYNRLPNIIYCRKCIDKSTLALMVDSYDLEICTGHFNIYTSKAFIGCYYCKEEILVKDIICEKCYPYDKRIKYCNGCGALRKFYRFTNLNKKGW